MKKRVIFVLTFLILFIVYLFVSLRGEYLEMLAIGKQYTDIFKLNLEYNTKTVILNFLVIYVLTYITTKFIKRGLKKFFQEDKKEMPKLPNKSISLVIGIITSMLTSNIITEKVLLALNSTLFGIEDPIFKMDLGYYVFQKPFIEFVLLYLILVFIMLIIYTAIYYIFVFNKYFEEGISIDTLKKSTFLKQLTVYLVIITIIGAGYIFLKTENILFGKFITLNDDTALYGAGIIDVTIRLWGYRLLAIIIVIAVIKAIQKIKKNEFKKTIITLMTVPSYLVLLFVVMLGFDLIYINKNELDKEKEYIKYNIEFTKNAYNINIDEIEIENSGTITTKEIEQNQEVIENVNIINEEATLANLREYQTSLGYYVFDTTKIGLYNINNKEDLVYINPREILSNETRTYNNKTYEYTHGYGAIVTSASNTDINGNLHYIQNEFEDANNQINITQPRIYFGLQTNNIVVTNARDIKEYDYPINTKENSENSYDGNAGIKLGFLDRLILGINQGDLQLAFSTNTTKESNIIVKRNIIERAKTIMPYLIYDEEPYIVITNEGKLVWVLDAYTMSNNYPYSQPTTVEMGQIKNKINYIRNSVKVLIDSYDGTIKFYITDRNDPIVMAYNDIYPGLFEDKESKIPEDISKNIMYSEFLYQIQADMLKKYHNVKPEVLYRCDDDWDIAKENKTKVSTISGTDISPYYTMVKTVDNEESELGLIIPYTEMDKQNIISYLIGTYDYESKENLKIYRFKSDSAILGTMQLDTLIEEDEKISKEIATLNVTGTKTIKNIIIVPINKTLLYIEPIYQVKLNENKKNEVPILKKIVVASGNKIAIGNDLKEALVNLLSQEAVSIEVESEDIDDIINKVINANNNLKQSNQSNNWEMIGKDVSKLQELINQLELLINKESQEKNNIIESNSINLDI